uniref:class I SAM-dependent methyltransferase n=1 Tax=Algoriphagus sp. TaxID=1872435 RepID=UPI004047A3E2
MEIERQNTRYHPLKKSNYFELNTSLSLYLDELKPTFLQKKILDIGAGEIPFKEFYKNLDVKTCDIQNNKTNTIDFIIKPGEPLPFSDGQFEIIFIFDVLEHIQDDLKFLQECNRILASGGIIVANIPFMYRYHEIPYDFRRYTPAGLMEVFAKTNFELVSLKKIGSIMFVAKTFLTEHQIVYNSFFKKIILKLVMLLLSLLSNKNEISEVSPFSFFCVAKKI